MLIIDCLWLNMRIGRVSWIKCFLAVDYILRVVFLRFVGIGVLKLLLLFWKVRILWRLVIFLLVRVGKINALVLFLAVRLLLWVVLVEVGFVIYILEYLLIVLVCFFKINLYIIVTRNIFIFVWIEYVFFLMKIN